MPNVLNAIIDVYMWVILLRLILQYRQVDYNNPLSQWTLMLTEPITKQIGRFVGKKGSIDYPTIIWLVAVTLIGIIAYCAVNTMVPNVLAIIFSLVFGILSQICFLYFILLLVMSLGSWFKGIYQHRAYSAVTAVVKPLLSPVRDVIPSIGQIDIAPAITGMIFLIGGLILNAFALAI